MTVCFLCIRLLNILIVGKYVLCGGGENHATTHPLHDLFQQVSGSPARKEHICFNGGKCCSCMDDCIYYGECCIDKFLYEYPINIEEYIEQFLRITAIKRHMKYIPIINARVNPTHTIQSLYMVSSCDNSRSPYYHQCVFQYSEYDLPTYDEYGTMFRNAYCALCHNITNYATVDVSISSCLNQSSAPSYSQYQFSLQKFNNCNIFILPSKRYQLLSQPGNYSKLLSTSKNMNCSERSMKLCQSYFAIVRDSEGRFWANPNCARCHGVDEILSVDKCGDLFKSVYRKQFYGNSITTNFSSYGTMGENNTVQICRKDHEFDVILGECLGWCTNPHSLQLGKRKSRRRFNKLRSLLCDLFCYRGITRAQDSCLVNIAHNKRCCRCDENCRYYGDCCVDKYLPQYPVLAEYINVQEYIDYFNNITAIGNYMSSKPVLKTRNSKHTIGLLHMVTSCYDTSSLYFKQCAKGGDTPVFDEGGLIYANAYCAKCHNVAKYKNVTITIESCVEKRHITVSEYNGDEFIDQNNCSLHVELSSHYSILNSTTRPLDYMVCPLRNPRVPTDTVCAPSVSLHVSQVSFMTTFLRKRKPTWKSFSRRHCKEDEIFWAKEHKCMKFRKLQNIFEHGHQIEEQYPWREKIISVQSIVSLACLTVSILAEIVVIVTYIAIKKLHNTPEKNVMCLTIVLLLTDCLLVTVCMQTIDDVTCQTVAILLHFLSLSLSAWSFVISYDLWKTIHQEYLRHEDELGPFKKYNIAVWCMASLVTIVTVVLGYFSNVYVGYGLVEEQFCWINGYYARIFTYVIPSYILLVSSIILLLWVIIKLPRDTTYSRDRDSNVKDKINLIAMAFKLFLAFGIVEVIGVVQFPETSESFEIANDVFGVVHTAARNLRGVFVFLAFILKKRIFQQYQEFYRNIIGQFNIYARHWSVQCPDTEEINENAL